MDLNGNSDARLASLTSRAARHVLDSHAHTVRFYDDDPSLLEELSRFLGAALGAGDSAIVIATKPHLDGLTDLWRSRGLDVSAAAREGRYIALDAQETLPLVVVDGWPDAARFNDLIGGLIERARLAAPGESGRVAVFGELVALLSAEGKHDAALRLEHLWHDLALTHPFNLHCAYPLRTFGKAEDAALMEAICTAHSGVIPAESYTSLVDEGERLRSIALLQQKAGALEAEVAARKQAEAELAARLRQQHAVAALGQRAVAGPDLGSLFEVTADVVARTLAIECCEILELLPGNEELQLRAWIRHPEDRPGQLPVRVARSEECTLLADEPVIAQDEPAALADPDEPFADGTSVRSSLSAVIPGPKHPYGVLRVHNTARRHFSADDDGFLQTVANVLAAAVERQRLEAALREDHFRALVQHAVDIVSILEPDGTVRYVSPGVERVFGFKAEELTGNKRSGMLHPDDIPRYRSTFASSLAAPGARLAIEIRVRHRDGSWRWVELHFTNLLDDPTIGGIVANVHDIQDYKQAEEQLTHQAFHDPLTGLPNRSLFLNRLGGAIAHARRQRGTTVAVLFLDLDGFKLINDSRGHFAGDALLVAVAQRLAASVPQEAALARFGGDEFAVTLIGDDAVAPTTLADRIIDVLRFPFLVEDRELFVSASIGIVARSSRFADPSVLLQDADIALYEAKANGAGSVVVFEPRMRVPVLARFERDTALRHAVERNELVLHHQPVVELATGTVVGVEALVRWNHPDQGLLGPGEFIRLAEETGVIVPIGGWVLREACLHALARQVGCPTAAHLVVSVNVSPRQLQAPGWVEEIAAVLRATGLDPSLLELEITESMAMTSVPKEQSALRSLRKLGVRLAIDDFGTGYSSLGRLRSLDVDRLKIDQSFVAGLEREADSRAIVRTIATLAHELGLAVTAEGVETAGQAAFLQEVGATWAQGFYFARPMNGEALGALFQSTARLPTRRETDNAVLSPSAHGAFLGRTDAALALRDVAG